MANISLRAYNREISNLIDRGQTDEAVAHCQYILQTYPKYIETYRLLGKAYLEGRQHQEAMDVFQRVLSVSPDDFITQVGMSIIKEEEDNLAASIWHMERAFEVQPSNQAIQDELKHLYGKRDGEEPLKIRLTRGALCRMYARGNQYRQAVAEIKSLLTETPDRVDLEILLARMYYSLNMKSEATDLCNKLLGKFPHCLEANRIMYKILLDSGKKQDAESYKQKIIGLDPYESLINDTYPSSEQVPEDMVSIAKLVYDPNAKPVPTAQQIDVAPPPEKESAPDWVVSDLTGGDVDLGEKGFTRILDSTTLPPEEHSAEPPVEAKASAAAPVTKVDETVQEEKDLIIEDRQNIVVDLPDETSTSTQQVEMETESDELPDWLKDTGKSSAETEEEIPDWLKASGWAAAGTIEEDAPPTSVIHIEEGQEEETPDVPIAPAEIPDWVQGLAPAVDEMGVEPDQIVVPEEVSEETSTKLNEWLSEEPAVEDKASSGGTASLHLPNEEDEEVDEASTPDWLKGLDEQAKKTKGQPAAFSLEGTPQTQDGPSIPKSPVPQPTQTDKLDLEDDFPIAGGTSILSPDDVPDWLQDLAAVPDSEGVVEVVVEPEQPPRSMSIEEPTRPSPRGVEPPQEILTTALPPEDNVPEWLSEFPVEPNNKITQTLPVTPEEMAGEMPSWLSMLDDDTSEHSEPVAKVDSLETPIVTQKLEPAPTEKLEQAESAEDKPTTSILPQNPEDQADELPEWLKELDGYPEGSSPIADAAQSSEDEFPDWLKGFGDSEPVDSAPITPASLEEAQESEEEVPNWLSDLDLKGSSIESSAVDVPDWLKGEAPEPTATEEEVIDFVAEPSLDIQSSPELVESVVTESADAVPLIEENEVPESVIEDLIDVAEQLPISDEIIAPIEEAVLPEVISENDPDEILTVESIAEEMPVEEPVIEESEVDSAELNEALSEISEEGTAKVEPEVVELDEEPLPEMVIEQVDTSFEEQPVSEEDVLPLAEEETIEPSELPQELEKVEITEDTTVEIQDEVILPVEVPEETTESIIEEPEPVSEIADEVIVQIEEVVEAEVVAEETVVETEPSKADEDIFETESEESALEPQGTVLVEAEEIQSEELDSTIQETEVEFDSSLEKAIQLIQSEDLESAQKEFERLVYAEKNLDGIIEQLSAATEKYPTDFGLWMTLGDAFGRSGKLQKALDSYSKAEEYLQ